MTGLARRGADIAGGWRVNTGQTTTDSFACDRVAAENGDIPTIGSRKGESDRRCVRV